MSHDKPMQSKINLDAKTAKWLLEGIQPFVADRPLNKHHLAKLVSEMRQGHFLPEITTIMVANLNGATYRLNGQHTATAVLQQSEVDPDFSLPGVTLLSFTVSDETELRKLYARIDRGAARTNRDVTISLLAGTSDFSEISPRVLKLLPTGLAIMLFEESNRRNLYLGETATVDVQGQYRALSLQVAALMDSLNFKALHHGHMFRGPVVAAMYATFAVDKVGDANRFWRAVATGVGFESETEPAARLRQLLKSVTLRGGVLKRGDNVNLGSEDVYRACLHAWNRFRGNGSFGQALKPTVLKNRPSAK